MLLAKIIQYIFTTYIILISIRIIASWFPSINRSMWFWWLCRFTDPYLNIFRRIIPPIGGVLDLSPMLAYFTLQLMEYVILRLIQ